jgi:predicted secreted protein
MHQVNTLIELRRIEKAFAVLGTPDVSEPMTAACKRLPMIRTAAETDLLLGSYYVNSHGLLTELRGLTRNYPFR